MDKATLLTLRLANQQLISTRFTTPKDIVSYMGAMQAQDFNMAKWAIGVRIRGIKDLQVEEAVNKGDIIRTHIMRPTWHFVSRDDICWIMGLSTPRVKIAVRSYDKYTGLTDEIVVKTNLLISKILEKESNLTRQELGVRLKEHNIDVDTHHLNHIMYHAELDGIVCSGIVKEKKQTYRLLEEIAPQKESLSKDEALYRLANKYFGSHGPATLQDFIWWSGLTTSDAKRSLELIRSEFIFEPVNDQIYIFHNSSLPHVFDEDIIHLMPAFDELFVSYKDRKEIVAKEHHKKVIVSNGVFKPAVFYNGEIIGIWNRVVKKNKIVSEVVCFSEQSSSKKKLLDKAIADFAAYV